MRWKTPVGLLALAFLVVAASATPTEAQWRHGPGGRVGPVVRLGVFWGPRFYDPFWGPFGFYYPPYPYYYGGYSTTADIRVQVEPKNAEVYVDGHYAGPVNKFDGLFKRLKVVPGGHEIQVYLDGYKTITDRRYFSPGQGYKIQAKMQKLAPGESSGPKPTPPPASADSQPIPQRMPPGPRGRVRQIPPPTPTEPAPPADQQPPATERAGADATNFGQLAIRVQPADAEIRIDGERWQGLPGQPRLVIDLPAGVHRVEIRKEGFEPFIRDVTVKPRETTPLNVSLTGHND